MEPSEFLLARIAEDEARISDPWKRAHWATCNTQGDLSSLMDECDCGLSDHLLAECDAKRRILDLERYAYDDGTYRYVLRLLALPYANHPDYREEWKP